MLCVRVVRACTRDVCVSLRIVCGSFIGMGDCISMHWHCAVESSIAGDGVKCLVCL